MGGGVIGVHMAIVQSTVVADDKIEHVVAITLGQWMVVKIVHQQETSCMWNMNTAIFMPVVCTIWKSSVQAFVTFETDWSKNKELKIFLLKIKQFIANGISG